MSSFFSTHALLFHVHFLFGGLILFAFIAALIFLAKHVMRQTFLKVIVWTLAIGIVGALLTSSFGLYGMMSCDMHGFSKGKTAKHMSFQDCEQAPAASETAE